ncbi:hypothetical protein WN944_007415 [Citrus x changshan-huyou]|uniref:Uncharacterized protein n=1 Tax=Citrus x changshan-huyou TaxID=2935761 RepID=A0AAP0MSD0_9ROSI
MENPESLEEGLIAKSSLAQPNPVIVTNEVGERSGFPESDNSSAATPVVVLSTLVTICGSFAYGCSVRLHDWSSNFMLDGVYLSNVLHFQQTMD